MTWFGGFCCVPKALRKNESTIMMREKLLVRIKNEGTILKSPNRTYNLTVSGVAGISVKNPSNSTADACDCVRKKKKNVRAPICNKRFTIVSSFLTFPSKWSTILVCFLVLQQFLRTSLI